MPLSISSPAASASAEAGRDADPRDHDVIGVFGHVRQDRTDDRPIDPLRQVSPTPSRILTPMTRCNSRNHPEVSGQATRARMRSAISIKRDVEALLAADGCGLQPDIPAAHDQRAAVPRSRAPSRRRPSASERHEPRQVHRRWTRAGAAAPNPSQGRGRHRQSRMTRRDDALVGLRSMACTVVSSISSIPFSE
jgi:hypothetical protein